jgi:ABC-type antimicrobial peptide transport system permease subunit
MLKNYIKIAWRNLIKQKGTTFISVFGLACAVGCCLVAYLFIEQVWFKGMLQPNKNEIYQLTYTAEKEEGKVTFGTVADPILELLPGKFSQINAQCRVKSGPSIVIHNLESFNQRAMFVDPGFMEMFSYQMEYGYPFAVAKPDQVILTYELSEKLFGNTNPLGQEISLVLNGEETLFKVGGVMQKLNDMEMFNFDLLVNIETISSSQHALPLKETWNSESWTFIQLQKGANPDQLHSGLEEIKRRQNEINPESPYLKLDLVAFTDLVKEAEGIENGVVSFLAIGPQILLGAIGLFILVLAVFNYINISILMASSRLKEIGIRKVIGSRKGQLIAQFLSENLMVCFLSIVFGCLLAVLILLPGFNQIASKSLKLDLLHDPYIWLFLIGLIGFITLASGLYPAVFVSSFKPVSILKGHQQLGSKSLLTSVLLTFQFTLAIISIVAGVAFLQTNYINENRDWGYDASDKIIVNIPDATEYSNFKDRISAIAAVEEMSGSQNYVGNWQDSKELSHQNKNYQIEYLIAEGNYSKILDLKLKQGRFLEPNRISDAENSILVNEKFIQKLGLTFPTDDLFIIDSVSYQIVGVVEDFHSTFFQNHIESMVIRSGMDSGFNYLTLKLNPGTAASSMGLVKEIWREFFPKGLFEGKLQTEVFDHSFNDVRGIQNIILFGAILSLLLSAMGLFGLVSLNINARIRDFCVRKIFGAAIGDLSQRLFKRYLVIWGVASVLGGSLAYLAVKNFLDSFFAFHSGVGLIPLGSGLIVLLTVIGMTVSTQLWKVYKSNPSQILKSE